jgi:polyisoprenyl-phosphate glycosyltransferase
MPKLISIVIPIYNEEKNIAPLYAELQKVLAGTNYDFEIIFVNDGSKDGSLLELEKLAQNDNRVKVADFARNFGKEIALSAGCHLSKGEAVITMDADLQHPPMVILDFLKKWEEGFEVIYTVRNENKGASLTKKLTSEIYWWVFGKTTSISSEPHSTDFRLIDKKVADVFRKFPERGRIFRGIIDWMGYKRVKIEFVANERNHGEPTYSYSKLIILAINSLTAFSLLPLRLAGYLGVVITSISSLLLLGMFIFEITKVMVFTAIAFFVVANTLLIGIVLICLGFIALYIARIHDEVVDRPLYIVREKINLD